MFKYFSRYESFENKMTLVKTRFSSLGHEVSKLSSAEIFFSAGQQTQWDSWIHQSAGTKHAIQDKGCVFKASCVKMFANPSWRPEHLLYFSGGSLVAQWLLCFWSLLPRVTDGHTNSVSAFLLVVLKIFSKFTFLFELFLGFFSQFVWQLLHPQQIGNRIS